MSAYKIKKMMMLLLGSAVLAGVLSVATDLVIAWQGREVSCGVFVLFFGGLTALLCFLFRRKPKKIRTLALGLLTLLLAGAVCLLLCWYSFTNSAAFSGVDQGKTQLYADRRVMLIVPHQDDEINVLGGVLEEYVRYGSEIRIVFVTNGDMYGLAEDRFREALEVCRYIGIPEENAIFLGYGDDWKADGPHIYNAQPGQVMESYIGNTQTYGTASAGVYREGNAYTVDNFLGDLKSVILEYRPEVIYCSDYDWHIDHKALTLAFEKTMGSILKEEPDYRPLVFKGYAYGTAWYAEPDFFETNILSTRNLFEDPFYQTPEVYRWEERLRLPVWDQSLSRSLFSCRIFETLALHASQDAHFQGARVINGDRVVWYRDTNSLCYGAQIQVSSGDGSLLNDFMIAESHDLRDFTRLPSDGTWIPEDGEKTATVTFPQPVSLKQIVLYDSPSPEDNVLSGSICFEDGTEVTFGPLAPEGAPTVLEVQKSQVTGFRVTLLDTVGSRAGLAEIEAFERIPDSGFRYIKLMDGKDNFIYDYWLEEGIKTDLRLYSCGLREDMLESLEISWDNQKCWAELSEGKIQIICPEGKTMLLRVSVGGTDISDTVRISNPGKLTRLQYTLCRTLEENLFQKYCDGYHRNSATYKLLITLIGMIRG